MAVIFGALVGPFTILIFFIVVPVCFLPLDLMKVRFVVFGNGILLLFGIVAAPIFFAFAVRPCCAGKHKNTRCRQDTKYNYFRFHQFASLSLDFN
jgi:fumarate reductase subunit D